MLAATIAFVSVVSCLNQQAFGRAKQFHEELFIHSGRAGGYRVCNAVNRKRERQTDDASSYASSHAPSHASPRQDVTGKMAPSLGPFFYPLLSSFCPWGCSAQPCFTAFSFPALFGFVCLSTFRHWSRCRRAYPSCRRGPRDQPGSAGDRCRCRDFPFRTVDLAARDRRFARSRPPLTRRPTPRPEKMFSRSSP